MVSIKEDVVPNPSFQFSGPLLVILSVSENWILLIPGNSHELVFIAYVLTIEMNVPWKKKFTNQWIIVNR